MCSWFSEFHSNNITENRHTTWQTKKTTSIYSDKCISEKNLSKQTVINIEGYLAEIKTIALKKNWLKKTSARIKSCQNNRQ